MKTADGSAVAGAEAVKNAPNAWLSYALDTEKLIAELPVQGDVVIDAVNGDYNEGKFGLTLAIDGILVGDGASSDNLKKVFIVEGAEDLTAGQFNEISSDFYDISASAGKVKFTVTPKGEDGAIGSSRPTKFFFKVRMK